MKRRRLRVSRIIFTLLIFISIVVLSISLLKGKPKEKELLSYVCSNVNKVELYDLEYNVVGEITRGSEVVKYSTEKKNEDNIYNKIKYEDKIYLINSNNLSDTNDNLITESELYVRTSTVIYENLNNSHIAGSVKKGEKVSVTGYDKLDSNGNVYRYKVDYNNTSGYVYSKYLVDNYEDSIKVYDENNLQDKLSKMGNTLGGGTATNLDYYPREKVSFDNNVMPNEVRSLYINSGAVKNIDKYIEFAKENNINAFVIDIKDNTSPAYDSPIMKEYSITNYNHALNDYEEYKKLVKKAIDAGIYTIGRITTFKDSYFVEDHKEVAIKDSNGKPFNHNGSYWPSAYNRYVWEFNVELAREAVKEIGFNEIQFDYVRFPDRTNSLEASGSINFNNTYKEEKAQALQQFIMYACDSIHEMGAYVSIDVFGESASNYVTAYGQFWPAISNVADVVSGMPYPDHFNPHEYGIEEVVWTVPYKLLYAWGSSVKGKQDITPTPAVVRTWIQVYNATKEPNVIYDSNKVSEQIQALVDSGLTGGYMTWNSGSNLVKYNEVKEAFRKVYQ